MEDRPKQCLSMLQWNCRTLVPDLLEQYLAVNRHDVVLLQSVKHKKNDVPTLNGYHEAILPVDLKEDEEASTAIYISKDVPKENFIEIHNSVST